MPIVVQKKLKWLPNVKQSRVQSKSITMDKANYSRMTEDLIHQETLPNPKFCQQILDKTPKA